MLVRLIEDFRIASERKRNSLKKREKSSFDVHFRTGGSLGIEWGNGAFLGHIGESEVGKWLLADNPVSVWLAQRGNDILDCLLGIHARNFFGRLVLWNSGAKEKEFWENSPDQIL